MCVLKCKYQNHKETFLNKKIKKFFILVDIKLIIFQQLTTFSMDVIVEQDRRGITNTTIATYGLSPCYFILLDGYYNDIDMKKPFAYFHHHSRWFEPTLIKKYGEVTTKNTAIRNRRPRRTIFPLKN
jgi:hypothetical protein